MKPWRRAVVGLVVAVAVAACGGPTPPWTEAPGARVDVRCAVAPTTVALLQPVTVTLDVWSTAGSTVECAPDVPTADFATTRTTAPAVPLFGGTWQRITLTCRPLRTGALELPAFTAKEKDGAGVATTAAQAIAVNSTLDGASAALEAPGEPFATPFRGWWWVGSAAAALAAGLAAWTLLRRARRRRPDALAVAVPPHVVALRALERLRHAPRTTPAQIEAFYVEVSQVLRVYLEERFGLCAPERTTEEFLRELEGGAALAREHRRELERFLSQCDLVKFAAVVPGEAEHLATWQLAAAFVEATRADRAAPAAEGAA